MAGQQRQDLTFQIESLKHRQADIEKQIEQTRWQLAHLEYVKKEIQEHLELAARQLEAEILHIAHE